MDKNIIDEAEKADNEEQVISEAPTEEQDLPEGETEVTEEASEDTSETKPESKKSASYRIRELNEEKKQAEERAKSLEDKLAELTGRVVPEGKSPYTPPAFENTEPEPILKPGEEYIDPVELERRLKARDEENWKRTQALIELNAAREANFERINKEAQSIVKKYPQLDPDSDQFDKDLSDSITEATESFVKANPTLSVKKFVDKLIKPYQRSIEKEVGEQREAITKQASQSALRPTQVPKGEKLFSELSLKEMEERLGVIDSSADRQ